MIFSELRPVRAGFFKVESTDSDRLNGSADEAALFYIVEGRGTWTLGPWVFVAKRGDVIISPAGYTIGIEKIPGEPLGFYGVYMDRMPGSQAPHLRWPWNLGTQSRAIEENTPPWVSDLYRLEIVGYFRRLQDELGENSEIAKLAARAQLMLLGVSVARMFEERSVWPWRINLGGRSGVPERASESIVQAAEYIYAHLGHDLPLSDLARVSGYSERRFFQLFRAAFQMSPMVFVRRCRIKEAKRLLTEGRMPVKDVAARLGFNDPQYFSRVFRQETGISPSEFVAGVEPVQDSARKTMNVAL